MHPRVDVVKAILLFYLFYIASVLYILFLPFLVDTPYPNSLPLEYILRLIWLPVRKNLSCFESARRGLNQRGLNEFRRGNHHFSNLQSELSPGDKLNLHRPRQGPHRDHSVPDQTKISVPLSKIHRFIVQCPCI